MTLKKLKTPTFLFFKVIYCGRWQLKICIALKGSDVSIFFYTHSRVKITFKIACLYNITTQSIGLASNYSELVLCKFRNTFRIILTVQLHMIRGRIVARFGLIGSILPWYAPVNKICDNYNLKIKEKKKERRRCLRETVTHCRTGALSTRVCNFLSVIFRIIRSEIYYLAKANGKL